MKQQPLHLVPSPCLPCSDLASPTLAPILLTDFSLANNESVCCGDGDMQNTPYTAAREQGLTWGLWQRTSGETQGQLLQFWSWSYRGPEAHYTPTKKEKLAAYEGVAGTEASPFGTTMACPTLDVQGNIPSTHHITSARWSKWVALTTEGV